MDMVNADRRRDDRREADLAHCSLKEARDLLLEEFRLTSIPSEVVDASSSLGRVLASDVTSSRNVPHYAASAVDGYAVDASRTAGATPATPVKLPCDAYRWVNTGMAIEDADSVIMVEDTSLLPGGTLQVFKSLTQGENVRAVGEDVMSGQVLAFEGDRVTPALVSLFLCAGLAGIDVRKRPKTIFIPTGNEIVDKTRWLSGETIPAGIVVDSNSEFVRAKFVEWGFCLDVHPILSDEPEILKAAILEAVKSYDVVLVSAGSAKGKRDHSAEAFRELGELLFRYVRMKPGRPVMAAKIDGKPVICIPGFPMSCVVTLWSLVYPVLKAISGEKLEDDYLSDSIGTEASTTASFLVQHSSPPGVAEWVRVKLASVGRELFCWPLGAGASVLWALAESDGIVFIEENSLEFTKGSPVEVMLTKKVDFSRRLLFQGSDDPAIQLLISFVRKRGMDFVIRAVGSMGGLAALAREEAHFAAAHLLDPSDGSYNDRYVEHFASGRNWRRKLVFYREQGLIVARGNPKRIRKFEDLASGAVVFENRQPGAGTRVLLDYMLKSNGLAATAVKGYKRQSITHMEAANKVASGVADVTLGIKAAADALSLDFVPVAREPYELVFSEDFESHPAASALMDALCSEAWRDAVMRMGGYEWP